MSIMPSVNSFAVDHLPQLYPNDIQELTPGIMETAAIASGIISRHANTGHVSKGNAIFSIMRADSMYNVA